MIREYVDDYIKYYPEKWRWQLVDSEENNRRYMHFRARKSSKSIYQNNDKLPDFFSIEKDANQFGLCEVVWADIFGIEWRGKKGCHEYVGAPNYEGNLYYYDEELSDYDEHYSIDYEYDAYYNQPPEDVYTRIETYRCTSWIDTANPVDVNYYYVVNNHLFKDTRIEIVYDDGEIVTVYQDYRELINGLFKHGKTDLVSKIFKTMNEHFIKLRDSDREEERRYYPNKTAEEMFLKEEEQ